MKTIILIIFSTITLISCSNHDGQTKPESQPVENIKGEKIPINKAEYTNYLVFKKSDTNYVYGKIIIGDKHFGDDKIKNYSIGHEYYGEWTILKLDSAFSLLFYHSLIMWVDGLDSDTNIPEKIIGISIHKTDQAKNYCFTTGNSYGMQDTEVGLFDGGKQFRIYVPEAWGDKGNLYTLTNPLIKETTMPDFLRGAGFNLPLDKLSEIQYRPTIINVK